MSNGQNIGFVPGGFEEATVFSHKEYRLFNNNRKGFIKYAIEYGYNLYPVFVFNESNIILLLYILKQFIKQNFYKRKRILDK